MFRLQGIQLKNIGYAKERYPIDAESNKYDINDELPKKCRRLRDFKSIKRSVRRGI